MQLHSVLYYRSKLDPHDQEIYDDLFQHWMHLDGCFAIHSPHCGLSTLSQAVHWDNPILFYIDYYAITYAKTPSGLRIKGGYLYTEAEIRRHLTGCETWGRHIMKRLPSTGMVEQALWLHDVILANVRYGQGNGVNAHNVVGVIKDGEAVCEGIAKTYKYLCDLANIPCIFVSGRLEQEPHGWNMLWVGGGTSFVDVTNDIRSGGYDRNHFLRSSAEMEGYQWDRALIPKCTVHNTSNAYFTVHSEQELLDTIRQNADRDSLSICLQFRQRLSDRHFQTLVNKCVRCYPPLAKRKFSYSLASQMLYVSQ